MVHVTAGTVNKTAQCLFQCAPSLEVTGQSDLNGVIPITYGARWLELKGVYKLKN